MRHLAIIAALAALLFAAPALAVGPPATTETPEAAPQPSGSALESLKNPAATVEALNKNIRASEQQNQAAVAAMNQAQGGAKPAPAPKAGGGKVIYGDIIIHK